ncbi:hypothetical protein RGU11_01815 [Rossellomorea marisflavi]|nr:hypothetical protein [Rossellomorea marisflavi]
METILDSLVGRGVRFVPLRPTAFCGVVGEQLQLRLQGLTCPLFPRESVGLRCTELSGLGVVMTSKIRW